MAATSGSAPPATTGSLGRRKTRALENFPLLLTIALTAQLVVLSPVINTAYWGDDDANAYVSGYLRSAGESFWHLIWSANVAQVKGLGRPMPLGVLQTYGIFYVDHNRVIYKLVLIALTLVASGMLALVVRRLGASPAASALAAALPAVIWQLHLPADPLVSYVGLVQTVLIYASGMILMFLAWLRRGGNWRLVIVLLLTVCAYVTYQDAYLLAIILVPVAWYERRCSWRRAVILALPALIVGAAFIILALILQGSVPPSSSGYQTSADPGAAATAWAKIITSGLPLVGWLVNPGPKSLGAIGELHSAIRGALVALLLFPILWAAARPAATAWLRDRRAVLVILAVTVTVMATPALLTSVSPRYQQLVVWGWGYLPIFFAGIGWALLGALTIVALLSRIARRRVVTVVATAALAMMGGVAAGVNAEGSARVVAYMQPVTRSRDLIEASFMRGVLGRVPSFGTVLWYAPELMVPTSVWAPGTFNLQSWTREYVNRPLTMRLLSPTDPDARVCTNESGSPAPCAVLRTPTFWLRTTSAGADGFVAVAEVGVSAWSPETNTMTAATAAGSQPVAYVEDPHIATRGGALPVRITLTRFGKEGRPVPATIPARNLRVLRRGSGWALIQLRPQPPFVAFSISASFV